MAPRRGLTASGATANVAPEDAAAAPAPTKAAASAAAGETAAKLQQLYLALSQNQLSYQYL